VNFFSAADAEVTIATKPRASGTEGFMEFVCADCPP
jgi:hypothetical protein